MSTTGRIARFTLAAWLPLVSGCGQAWQEPRNAGTSYSAASDRLPDQEGVAGYDAIDRNAARCIPSAAGAQATSRQVSLPLSPGDLLQLSLPANEAPSGLFKVGTDGFLRLGELGDVDVSGLTPEKAEASLRAGLVARGYYRPGHAHVTLRLVDRGPLRIYVSGAVFAPGRTVVGSKVFEERNVPYDTAGGDAAPGRSLSAALLAAGGVRPDADLAHVTVRTGGQAESYDLSGFVDGKPGPDPQLGTGASVEVPSRGCFQAALARPTPITPPGIRAYLSNLTSPAPGNASSGIGKDSNSFPYGTRLSQAMVSANCVGGVQETNAARRVVLMSLNPVTGRTEVIQRRVEDLVRRADRDAANPVLMPGDALACYDSPMTNVSEVIRSLMSPFTQVLPR